MNAPLMQLTSKIAGKNSTVRLFPGRVGWERAGMGAGAKGLVGTATPGVAPISTGVAPKLESEMAPLRSVSHVASKRDGLSNTKATLSTACGDVGLRCSLADAKAFVSPFNTLVLG